jgi:hypothetical protein
VRGRKALSRETLILLAPDEPCTARYAVDAGGGVAGGRRRRFRVTVRLMLKVDPGDVAIQMDVIRSSTTLERARAGADPREDPTALVVREGGLAATRLLDALGPLTLAKRAASSCAWVPRARLLRALERVEPLEAIRLARAASADVGGE